MAIGAPTSGLGALEISHLCCYSLTYNGLGTLNCPFKMALEMGTLQNPYFKACFHCDIPDDLTAVGKLC